MWKAIKKTFNWLLDVIYPPFCLRCGRLGEYVCERCYSHLDFTLADNLVPQLFTANEPVYLQDIRALLVYDPLVKKILHHYKYLGVRDLSRLLGYWLYQFGHFEADIITFIPIHQKRFGERGYNQSLLIAQELSRLSGIPCRQLLRRRVHRQKQALSRNKAERWQKTKNIFAPVSSSLDRNSRILLVDDVVTSGATLNEAARVLQAQGFNHISALALAHGD